MAELVMNHGAHRRIAAGHEVQIYGVEDATDVNIVADVLIANGALTIAAQPRGGAVHLVFSVTDANSSITSLDATIVGTIENGTASTSESVSLDNGGAGGTHVAKSTNRWLRIDSITLANAVGNGAGDNVKVGTAIAASEVYGTALTGLWNGGVFPAENDWIVRGSEDELVVSITANQASTGGIDIEESDNGTDLNATLSANLVANTPYASRTKLTRRLYRFRFTNDAAAHTNTDITVRARRSRTD